MTLYIYKVWPRADKDDVTFVCAENARDAKEYAESYFMADSVELRARRIAPAPDTAEPGEFEDWQFLLKKDIIKYAENVTCPRCGSTGVVVWYNQRWRYFYCVLCRDLPDLIFEQPLLDILSEQLKHSKQWILTQYQQAKEYGIEKAEPISAYIYGTIEGFIYGYDLGYDEGG